MSADVLSVVSFVVLWLTTLAFFGVGFWFMLESRNRYERAHAFLLQVVMQPQTSIEELKKENSPKPRKVALDGETDEIEEHPVLR